MQQFKGTDRRFPFYVLRMQSSRPGAMDRGWGNGYVQIPKNHFLYGMDFDVVSRKVNVYEGLTFGEALNGEWVFGWDTGHSVDTIEQWPEERVIRETMSLSQQLFKLKESDFQEKNDENQINSFDNCEVCGLGKQECNCK